MILQDQNKAAKKPVKSKRQSLSGKITLLLELKEQKGILNFPADGNL